MKTLTWKMIKNLNKNKVYEVESNTGKKFLLYKHNTANPCWCLEGVFSCFRIIEDEGEFNKKHTLRWLFDNEDFTCIKREEEIKNFYLKGVSKKHIIETKKLHPYTVLKKGDFCEDGKNKVILEAIKFKLGKEKYESLLNSVTYEEAIKILKKAEHEQFIKNLSITKHKVVK